MNSRILNSGFILFVNELKQCEVESANNYDFLISEK